jgi:DNA-binding IclR family transcriptional regulator
MTQHKNHRIVAAILDALQNGGRPCTRSELAGRAQLTIKQLSTELEYLVELGAVTRQEEGASTFYALRQPTIRPLRVG